MTKIGLYDIVNATTPEFNKSLEVISCRLWLTAARIYLEIGEENGIVFVVPTIAGTQGMVGFRPAPP